jgi:ABC-type nitrate/sulfonate/bicarbonate transport system substrate-binding protein
MTITIAEPLATVDFGILYVAQASGEFAKQHLQVKITSAGSSALNEVISGQSDLTIYSTGVALTAVDEGKPLSIIYAAEADYPSALVTSKNITSIGQLKSAQGCRLATLSPGAEEYYFGRYYVSNLGLPCTLVPVSTATAQVAGIESGGYQAAVLTYTQALTVESAHSGNVLINPGSQSDMSRYAPSRPYPSVVIFGVPSHLSSIKPAVTAFIRALKAAENLMSSESVSDIAALIVKSGELPAVSQATVEQDLNSEIPYLTSQLAIGQPAGSISGPTWTYTLAQLKEWGIQGFDSANPANEFSKVVDMSYFNS